ncbi:protein of unknown function [Mariniphaga anaerophila]|uniref:DUF4271 domain-containing protein n=1 Tax=Mariniphaga anaerophila TaxID=1484053 RepID=A0A1M5CXK7_9BACT|nr:DUF4271 domain-containing protein [Mariniphaga anaerophila]SHF59435.1 protein of unknown function [Mariniphaga anaerophila]
MEQGFTYQYDTVRSTTTLPIQRPLVPKSGELNINRSQPVPLAPIPERETQTQKVEPAAVVKKPAPPTLSQQRYWWWRQESKLLVGDSRYMTPRNELQLVTISKNEKAEFHLPARQINRASYDWLTILLLIALVLFASVKKTWNKYIENLFHSVVNYSTSIRMFQEKNTSVLQGAFQLDILFYLVFSAFAFQLLVFFSIDLPFENFQLFLFSAGLVIVYFFAKKLIYRLVGFTIEKTGETGEYLFNMNNFTRIAGVILFPVVTIIAFYPFNNIELPVTIGVILIALIYFLLIIRGFVILLKKQFSIFYLFLYFCTLEFVPLVLLYKILVL